MMNCTNHFVLRWVERIVGIKSEKEIKDYISKNRDMISEHANETLEYSEFLWHGQIGDNVSKNYYIKDDIVFVANTSNDALITVFKIDLGFTPELNKTVRKGLIQEIRKLTQEKEMIDFESLVEAENKEHQSEQIKDEIKLLEQQLENLRKQKVFKDEEVKQIKAKSLNTGLELKRYTQMLVNSKEYKEDLRSNR